VFPSQATDETITKFSATIDFAEGSRGDHSDTATVGMKRGEGVYAKDGSPSISAVIDANMMGTSCARVDDESAEGFDSSLATVVGSEGIPVVQAENKRQRNRRAEQNRRRSQKGKQRRYKALGSVGAEATHEAEGTKTRGAVETSGEIAHVPDSLHPTAEGEATVLTPSLAGLDAEPRYFLGVTDSTAEAAADRRAGSKKAKAVRVDVVIGTGPKKSKTMRTREDEAMNPITSASNDALVQEGASKL